MSKRYLLFCFSAATLASSLNGYYCVQSLSDSIFISADWMYLRRSKIQEHNLVVNNSILDANGNPEDVLRTQDLCHDWNWKTGLYGNITYVSDACSSLEALYYYVFPWHGRRVAGGFADLSFPFEDSTFTNDFNNANFVEARYRSQLQNGEFNYWRHLTPRRINYFSASWICGFRFLYVNEHFSLAFTQGTDTSDYRIHTKNYLYGAQLGFVFECNPSSRWTWAIIIKGAGFLNDARSFVFLGDQNNTLVLRDFEKKKYQAAFLIEGMATLMYQWCDHFNIHIKYQAFQATGLALAPEQRDKDSHTTHRHIDVRGDIVLDGFSAGITYSF